MRAKERRMWCSRLQANVYPCLHFRWSVSCKIWTRSARYGKILSPSTRVTCKKYSVVLNCTEEVIGNTNWVTNKSQWPLTTVGDSTATPCQVPLHSELPHLCKRSVCQETDLMVKTYINLNGLTYWWQFGLWHYNSVAQTFWGTLQGDTVNRIKVKKIDT